MRRWIGKTGVGSNGADLFGGGRVEVGFWMIEVLGGLGRSPEYLDIEIRPEGDGVWVGLTVGPEIVDDRGNPHHGEDRHMP